MNEAKQNR